MQLQMIEPAQPELSARVLKQIETGSFTRKEATVGELSKLVIASFNIRYAAGSFLISGSLFRRAGLSLPGRRARLVTRHIRQAARAFIDQQRIPRPDILALQEADQRTARAGGIHVARELAQQLLMDYAYLSAGIPREEGQKSKQWYLDFEEHILPDDEGDTGLATLSRIPFAAFERLDLPWSECAWRPRLSLATSFACGGTQLHIFNSHIDPHASVDEQLEQHSAVLAHADGLPGAVVLLGDFNTLTRRSSERMRALLEAHGYTTPMPTRLATWRAGLIRLHTDWVFVRGLKVRRWGVLRRLGVSDHWPVWIEVELMSNGKELA